MNDDVFHDNDGVVDDQADGRGEAAKCHQVEALADDPEEEDGDRDGDRDDQAGDERRSPIAQEEEEDEAGEHEADEDGISHAADGLMDEFGLIVKRRHVHAGGQDGLERFDLGGDRGGDRNGV